MRSSKKLSIKVLGAFDIFDHNGQSLRPSGRKDCALIAMLALTRNHRQTRTWLQDKLWGDRGPAQAAASLRQSLTMLRTLFNSEGDVLAADRTWVWLEKNLVDFDHLAQGARGEVLRGLDLREEGFNDWLRQVRAEFEERDARWGLFEVPSEPDRRWYLDMPTHLMGEAGNAGLCEFLAACIIEALSTIGLQAIIGRPTGVEVPKPRASDMVIRMRTVEMGSGATFSVTVTDGFGLIKWQVRREIYSIRGYDLRTVQIEVAQMLQDFAARTEAESLKGARWSAHSNGCQALMGILVPGSVPISEIVRCSEAAIASNEKGIYHALLGFGHLLLYGEREKLIAPDVDEVMKSFRTALRLSPENGLVQGLAGHSYGYLLRDLERNALMTREAVRLLPGSGPSWSFRAISLAYCGRYDEAVRAASNAVFLSRGTAMQPLTQSTELFARLMAGDVNGAILAGEAALDGIVFRPTIVDLMTAYARAGRIEDGRAKLGLLVQREPNLSLELLKSQDYPIVNPAHRAAVIEAANQLGLA